MFQNGRLIQVEGYMTFDLGTLHLRRGTYARVLYPHKIMHYTLMVILPVHLVCFATDSWSSFPFFYDQECARTSYRPQSWV